MPNTTETRLPLADLPRRARGPRLGRHAYGLDAAQGNGPVALACGQACGELCAGRTHPQVEDTPVRPCISLWTRGGCHPHRHAGLTCDNAIPRGVDENLLAGNCRGEGLRARPTQRPRVDAVAEAYDGGPVAALRRIGFLLERGREDTYKVKAFRGAAAAILPLSGDEVRARAEAHADRAGGVGARTRRRGASGGRRQAAGRLAALGRSAGAAGGGWRGAARPAPGRPAHAFGLERRRLAGRGDGGHRDGGRPRVPVAHRPLAPAPDRERAVVGAAEEAARVGRRGEQAPGARAGARCSRGSRSTSSTTAPRPERGDARPARPQASPACTPS